MHYIGKNYETTVYKCDDEKIDCFLGQIFSDDSEKKKRDKCIQRHYIGKSYETTVYMCDDEKIDRFLGQIFSDDSEKKAWQVYTKALYR